MNASKSREAYLPSRSRAQHRRLFGFWGRVTIGALFLLALIAPFTTASTQAQAEPPTVLLDPPQASAGAIVLVNGRGFGPGNTPLSFFWDGKKVATHLMETTDTFSIPFPVPADANPGEYRIGVCAGEGCDGNQTLAAGAILRVSAAFPHFAEQIAYIYDTDKTQAADFAAMLGRAGLNVIPIPLADVAQTNWGAFKLVLVGSDTGSNSGDVWVWGDENENTVAALAKSPRILGIGKGGHAFFGKLGLRIGAPNGTILQAQKITSGNLQLTSLRIPYDLTTLARNQRPMPLFATAVDTVMIDVPAEETDLLPHALLDAGRIINAGLVVGQGCRTLWGFGGAPAEMSALGQAYFVNMIVFALGNNCAVTLTAPCGPLVNQATIPAPATIDFDDMENAAVIGDFYANSHGVRFQKSSTTNAIIYGNHTNDPSLPRSAPNAAVNSAAYPATSENVPFPIFFEGDQSHVGMWIGNGEGKDGQPANLNALLTAFDREGKKICSARLNPVPVSHTTFLGLTDAFGRIARIQLDYGPTTNSESIDDLIFGPFAPANNIHVCQQLQTACVPATNAEIIVLRNGIPVDPPASIDDQGNVAPRSRILFGDSLWARLPVSDTRPSTSRVAQRTSLFYTNGAPQRVQAAEFNRFADNAMPLVLRPSHPLLLYHLTFSTQWSLLGDNFYQARLRSHIQKAANYLYDFTDGQVSLGEIHIYQNYDMWDEADVRIYASNNLRPHAEIGGVSEAEVADPLIADISYSPGHTFMGRTWNRFNLPGEPGGLGVDVSNDWPLALAHELSHYLFYLFDTYLAVTPDGEIVETNSCTGSAMGWVYEQPNTEFVFDAAHWASACGDTLANHTLNRTEWATILLWYSSLFAPTTTNPGPFAPPVPTLNVTVHPPSNPAILLPNQTFALNYQAGETASGEARAFLLRDNRIIDQGKPDEGSTQITLIGAQTNDRFCVFDVNDFGEGSSSPRHQYGCELLAAGDNTLQMEKDDAWAPIIEISHATSRTIGVTVTQAISPELSLHAVLYPEDSNTPTAIVLAAQGGTVYTGIFHSPVDAAAAYIQIYVDETASEENPRRETLVDYGVGGGGAQGPATWYGGVPVISSDGKAEFARRSEVFLKRGEFMALQSMSGMPRPPAGRQIIGQSYRLVAFPPALADDGYVTLRVRPSLGALRSSRSVQTLPQVVVAFWDGMGVWTPIKSINRDDLIDGRVAIAPSRGVGVYALLLEEETPPIRQLYLPQIGR